MSEPTIESLQIENQFLQGTIASLQIQLARLTIPDWIGLVNDLKAAGFYVWASEAIVAAMPDPTQPGNLIDEVAAMKSAALIGDLRGVLDNFGAIAMPDPENPETGYQGFPPTEYAVAWQAVLDSHGIPEALMTFRPFISVV